MSVSDFKHIILNVDKITIYPLCGQLVAMLIKKIRKKYLRKIFDKWDVLYFKFKQYIIIEETNHEKRQL